MVGKLYKPVKVIPKFSDSGNSLDLLIARLISVICSVSESEYQRNLLATAYAFMIT